MARGWESKSVEDQIEAAEARSAAAAARPIKAKLAEQTRRRESLLLSRTRVARELESSQNPRYREQKQKALDDLDAQLAALEP
jgi:hypothetical protein